MSEAATAFRSDLLAGRRALVTGGGSGLGQAIATGLAAVGADGICLAGGTAPSSVGLSDHDGDRLKDLTLKFPVQGSGIDSTTTEVCVRGAFSPAVGPGVFEARGPVNVK